MKTRQRMTRIALILTTLWTCAFSAAAQEKAAPIPESKIAALATKLGDQVKGTSAARRRLAVRRVIREGDSLLETYPTAPNRYQLLGILFRGRRELLSLDKSVGNREALLKTCRQLASAPDEYAAIRFDADLLLSQTELARKGADLEARGDALRPLIKRYRDTPVEAKVLRTAMVIALEFGDTGLISDIRRQMAERFAGDLEMIMFQRDKLAGQVFGAPFVGAFKRAGGEVARFPIDCLGRRTAFYFWSKEGAGKEDIEQLATAWKEKADEVSGHIEIVSFNLDELPDAGQKILRELGVDWPAMHLPGGRNNPIYRAYVRTDPRIVTVSPTGYTALVMAGNRGGGGRKRDYSRWLGSPLRQNWTKPRYCNQLQSLFMGEFLILDPTCPFDPVSPPELKAIYAGDSRTGVKLSRTTSSVPAEKLRAIQGCFVAPPFRYRMTREQVRANYEKADALCRKAIAAHTQATDLWIVRNRRTIALLGLWKLSSDKKYLERAVGEAKVALGEKCPPGTDVAARFCLATEALRAADADPKLVIGDFLKAAAGKKASGPALAAAAILALGAGDRVLHEHYRRAILDKHTDNPMLWTAVSFLVDRYHRYWLYRAPYMAGWSFGRRQGYFLSWGEPEDARRVLQAELKTLDGDAFRIPKDTAGKWTAIIFMGRPDHQKRDFHSQAFLTRTLSHAIKFAEGRPFKDVSIIAAILDDDADAARKALAEKETLDDFPTLLLPGGMQNPIVQKLGILDADERVNIVILRSDGTIAAALSGLTLSYQKGSVIQNVLEWHDEKAIDDALSSGDLEKAKRLAFKLAPLVEPVPPDENKRVKKSDTTISLPHLRSRAKVYMAMKDWRAALADAEEVYLRLKRRDGFLSMRTDELEEAERLRATILSALGQPKSER